MLDRSVVIRGFINTDCGLSPTRFMMPSLGGSIEALLVTKRGLAMSKDEEITGPGARDFGLASPVKEVSNRLSLSPS
jgi:hypothetical protein